MMQYHKAGLEQTGPYLLNYLFLMYMYFISSYSTQQNKPEL